MTTKSTKHALVLSVIAILVTVVMLAGTTFAWFTDSVTSAGNIIKTGSLEVTLEHSDDALDVDDAGWIDASKGAIFNYANWEPGYSLVKYVKIENEGTLDLKFMLNILPNEQADDIDLADVIEVYMIDGAQAIDRAALTTDSAAYVGTLAQLIAEDDGAAHGVLYANDADAAGNYYEIYTIALKMSELAGNEYQNKSVGGGFAVQLLATQLASEEDSFDADYDVDATLPKTEKLPVADDATEDTVIGAGNVDVSIPVGADGGLYEVSVSNDTYVTDDEGNTTFSFDLDLTKDGNKVEANGTKYTVTIQLEKNLNLTAVKHDGEAVADFVYDKNTGVVTFQTEHFSPFSVEYFDGKIDATEDFANFAKGGEFVLVGDVVFGEMIEIPAGVKVTLDLGGYDLTCTLDDYALDVYGELFLTGKSDDTLTGSICINKDAALTMERVTVQVLDTELTGFYAVLNYNGSFTMNSGKLYTAKVDAAQMHSLWAYGGTTVINDGEIISDDIYNKAKDNASYALLATNGADVTIGQRVEIYGAGGAVCGLSNAKITVNGNSFGAGATFEADNFHAFYIRGGASLFINGASSVVGEYSSIYVEKDGNASVTGGTFGKDISKYVADGYKMIANPVGGYTVVADAPVVVTWSDGKCSKGYDTLTAAMNVGRSSDLVKTITVYEDITEEIKGLSGNIVCGKEGGVTITGTYDNWVYASSDFVIGKGVTFNTEALFLYCENGVINGDVTVGSYYQRYAGSELTINAPGSLTVTTETCIIRYMEGDAKAGIYVNGDNDDTTVELKLAVAYFYQGMISAKDATISVGTYWQRNTTDGEGSANLVLDNSKLNVTVNEHNIEFTGNSTVTLKNGSSINGAGGITYGPNAVVTVDETSSIVTKR